MKNRLAILLSAAFLILCLCACKTEQPPKEDTPAPAAHDGMFVSDYGTLEFNGDGESVTVNISAELAQAMGLPENEFDGTYAFTFHHNLWRYDQAERFCITCGDVTAELVNDFTKTDENTIAFTSPADGSDIVFEKEAQS